MSEYHDRLLSVLARYQGMAEEHGEKDLIEFIHEFDAALRNELPLMKMNRWMGYLQGVLITKGYTTVTAERDFTRPFFRPIDFEGA